MRSPNKLKDFWEYASNNRLIVACCSALIFAGMVAWLGSKFQHKNWIEEHKIATQTSLYEKTFDKRATIIQRFFYLADSIRSNSWNIYDAYRLNDKNDINSTWQKGQELSAQYKALSEEMKIYFDITGKDAIFNSIAELHELWANNNRLISSIDFSQEAKAEKIKNNLNAANVRTNELINIILNDFSFLLYKIDIRFKQVIEDSIRE